MELEQPLPGGRRSLLDRPLHLVLPLSGALVVLVGLGVVAILTRFWDLGGMALHHDESLHAVYSYYLYDRGSYVHQPLMHGPVLFHLTALGYWLFGDTDATARLLPALLGVALVLSPWLFRDWMGRRGALATGALILISPALLYYSRFLRHDIFAAMWTVLIVYGLWAYLDRGRGRDLALMVVGWSLLFSQKEVSFLFAALFWTFLLLFFLLRRSGRLGERPALSDAREFHLLILIGALLAPLASALVLHLPALINGALGTTLPILDPGMVGGNSETSVYNDPRSWSLAFDLRAAVTAVGLGLGGYGVAARWWDGRRFLMLAALFWGIFFLFHTTFFTNPGGLGSGVVGALGYWLEQHGVRRGEQPWFYYLMLLPLYEFLPLIVGGGGFFALLLRRRLGPVIHPPGSARAGEIDARALWPWFNLFWFLGALLLLSTAGEKMPWLLVHLALPLAFLGGWAIGRLLDGVSWREIAARGGLWFALLMAVQLLALAGLALLAFRGQAPFAGAGDAARVITGRWLIGALVLLGTGWGLTQLATPLGRRGAARVTLLTLIVLLGLATVRFALIASFVNGDRANEPLIFVQSSPNVVRVARDLEALSQRLYGDNRLTVAYDSESSWPFEWYLRDFPNRIFYGAEPENQAGRLTEADAVLVGWRNESAVAPFVDGFVRQDYMLRWWFPEEYKQALQRIEYPADPNRPGRTQRQLTGVEAPSFPNVLRNLIWSASQPEIRADFFDFYLHRRVRNPLGGERFSLYLAPELSTRIWAFGGGAAPVAAPGQPVPAAADLDALRVDLVSAGTIEGLFQDPKDVAVMADGTLAVVDGAGHRLLLLDAAGALLREIGGFGEGAGQFNEPWGVAVGPDGAIYVADTWNHRVQKFSAEGEWLQSWGGFADSGGTSLQPGLFYGPRDLIVNEDGQIFVADTGNKRIQLFDADGTFVAQVGGSGAALGQLAEPVGLALAPDGSLWVADTWHQRLQQFDRNLVPLRQIPLAAWAGQNVANKPYLAAGSDRLWVTDPERGRVIELDLAGTPQRLWGTAELQLPFGLDAADDRLWVVDAGTRRLVAYPLE